MTKNFVFRARVDNHHQKKIRLMLDATGYKPSELLRALVEQAEVTTQPSIRFINPVNANSDTTLAGIRVAVAA
jgi:hypothetical protein